MTKNKKTLIVILTILCACFAGLVISLYCIGYYYDSQLVELVSQVKVGMNISEVEKILPFECQIYTQQDDAFKAWTEEVATEDEVPDEIVDSCHLYIFFCSSEYRYMSADCIYVYIDPETKTVKHVALQYW